MPSRRFRRHSVRRFSFEDFEDLHTDPGDSAAPGWAMDYLPTDGRESGHAEHFARVGLATGAVVVRPGTRAVGVRGGAVCGDGDAAGARHPCGRTLAAGGLRG